MVNGSMVYGLTFSLLASSVVLLFVQQCTMSLMRHCTSYVLQPS